MGSRREIFSWCLNRFSHWRSIGGNVCPAHGKHHPEKGYHKRERSIFEGMKDTFNEMVDDMADKFSTGKNEAGRFTG